MEPGPPRGGDNVSPESCTSNRIHVPQFTHPFYWSAVYQRALYIPGYEPKMNLSKCLVSQKSSDSGLHIQLHPLVLLTISDQITRHVARQQHGPIIGGLLGQQNGREITLEHAFECPVTSNPNDEILLPAAWFEERLQQFKDVHKNPALDLVGWWSTAPSTGPTEDQLPFHRQILQHYNESAVYLAFHTSQLENPNPQGGKLPLTIYESVHEGETASDASKDMQVDSEEPLPNIRFRELAYSMETGESEMIGINTIVQASGTASLNATQEPTKRAQQTKQTKQTKANKNKQSAEVELSQEEEELIASLHTRLNAVRILESRLSIIKSYLLSLTEADSSSDSPKDETSLTELSHPILRNINSLLSHLSILSPSEQSTFATEVISQHNDVQLISLLGQLGENVKAMREMGRRSEIVQGGRQAANVRKDPMGSFNEELWGQTGIPISLHGQAGRGGRRQPGGGGQI
ncbi:JAB1/Mov34/MPN/PAD-1 [Penicillium bovifimosum]|uniref:COP9 signalosome complex subunit 6 n=1 Tax=Penicillium bovifimosum TaxID=126998 RepID=A0A9W9HG46_9EURO|nr:JAB1/Mov34/MPN/PAD-1 [Penicillium bovifimosum]KAJ5146255.1 JAB1/Mov34/MPN/PAD-1 [Penicillium bovifimosum]